MNPTITLFAKSLVVTCIAFAVIATLFAAGTLFYIWWENRRTNTTRGRHENIR